MKSLTNPPYPGTFYPSDPSDLSNPSDPSLDRLSAKLDGIALALESGCGVILSFADAEAIRKGLVYPDMVDVAMHFNAIAAIQHDRVILMPLD